MKKGFTYIAMLMDRSGSMSIIRDDAIGGMNEFIEQQKRLGDGAQMSLSTFDNQYDEVFSHVPIADVRMVTRNDLVPRGSTALRDAFYRMVVRTGEHLASLKEDERPDQVIFVVVSDGAENASTEVSPKALADIIKLQTDTYGWKFMFLGGNMDALKAGAEMNVRGMGYDVSGAGMRASARAASAYVGYSRMGNDLDAEAVILSGHVGSAAAQKGVKSFEDLLDDAAKKAKGSGA